MITIQRAYKVELDLNNEQTTACRKHAGAARWAYNGGLKHQQEAYRKTSASPSAIDLHRELNALNQTQVPWMYEVSKCAPKAAQRLSKQYREVANQRANTLHHLTTSLAKTKSVVVIEDLHVAGMLKNHHLAQAIADVGSGEFRRQLTYKTSWYGSRVIVVSRWEPSSKTCSGCGWYDETLDLADRTFQCRNPQIPCGLVLDRDLNAAINLVKLADSSPDNANACGEESAGRSREASVQLASMKQEPNTGYASA